MKREYRAQGRYGQTWVDEFREGSSGTWGDSLGPFTRKVGQSVADKLNEAYDAGETAGYEQCRQETTNEHSG